jgi:hypothetical protein
VPWFVDKSNLRSVTIEEASNNIMGDREREKIERATKHTWDVEKMEWISERVMVIIDPRPFQQGCMRTAVRFPCCHFCFLSFIYPQTFFGI